MNPNSPGIPTQEIRVSPVQTLASATTASLTPAVSPELRNLGGEIKPLQQSDAMVQDEDHKWTRNRNRRDSIETENEAKVSLAIFFITYC